MMAEILVKAVNAPTWLILVDREKAEAGCYRKGDIVEVREDGKIIGPHWEQSEEKPPTFVIVKIPGTPKAQVVDYMESWRRVINFTQISHDPGTGTYVFEAVATVQSVNKFEHITRPKVKRWIEGHGGIVLDSGENWVRVEWQGDEMGKLKLKADALDRLGDTIKRRKWRFPEADVDWALSQGGVVEITKQQAKNKIISKWETPFGE